MQLVADNLQITDPAVAAAVENGDATAIGNRIKKYISAGAHAIDINSGPLKGSPEKMRFLVEAVQAVTERPVLLDSSNPAAIEAGLMVRRGPTVINGVSLEPEKLSHMLPLARRFDTDVIGYLLYPNSHVPAAAGDMMDIALELFQAIEEAGIERERLIIDPVVAPLMWENGTAHNMAVLDVIGSLSDLLGFPVRTIAGISNLTTGSGPVDKKRLMERTFLSMMAGAGLSMALVNIFHADSVHAAYACNALLAKGVFTWAGV